MFYDKVVAHEQIGHYFNGIDMMKLKRHQVRLSCLFVCVCAVLTMWQRLQTLLALHLGA